MIEHHADFAIPVTHRLYVQTRVPRRNGSGMIAGWVIALGWWVEANVNEDGTPGQAVGTLYLVVDREDQGAPAWIAEGNIQATDLHDFPHT
jgi:hypothetical protein